MSTILFLFLGIAAFGTLVSLIVVAGADDNKDECDDYWRDV